MVGRSGINIKLYKKKKNPKTTHCLKFSTDATSAACTIIRDVRLEQIYWRHLGHRKWKKYGSQIARKPSG